MSSRQKIFLRAEWKNLLIANFICDEKILQKHLPAKTELDTFESNNLVSLVAFQFLQTSVLGIKFPFHTNFVEVNLRFYVKYKENGEWKRGVVFISEIVPRFMITFIANTLYNENYTTLPTSLKTNNHGDTFSLHYTWGKDNFFQALASVQKNELGVGSIEEFITEHYKGFAKMNALKTVQYTVEHPRWLVYPLHNFEIRCNYGKLYGSDFEFLQTEKPHSVLLAEGSDILVRKGVTI